MFRPVATTGSIDQPQLTVREQMGMESSPADIHKSRTYTLSPVLAVMKCDRTNVVSCPESEKTQHADVGTWPGKAPQMHM